jgi:hypothetical protein
MIRIDEIYNNTFWPWIKHNGPGIRMFMCDPFGRSDPDSVVNFGSEDVHEHNYIFFFDQEPIHLNIHMATFEQVVESNKDINSGYYWKEDNGSYQMVGEIVRPPGFVGPGYLVTSEKNSENVEAVCNKFNWKSYYYFFHGWAALDWYRGYDKTFLIKPIAERAPTKTFLAPNRIIAGERRHRLEMLYHIFKQGMTDNHISCPAVCPVENISIVDAAKPLIDMYPDIQDVFRAQQLPINFAGETDHPMHSCWLSLFDQAADSLLYLVTETVATGRRHHITEKTFKPIAMGMPFVLVATAGSLEYLRSYGFKTFGHVWDESYDTVLDDHERIQAVASLLQTLCDLSVEERIALFNLCRETIEHNWNHFYNGGFERILWAELQDMLNGIEL